jgi:uncharacterized protein
MNSYSFHCFGHQNIQAAHKNTLEITKDNDVSIDGDCIIGVRADFHLTKIKEWMEGKTAAKMILECGDIREEVSFEINQDFLSDHEIVLRVGEFKSTRTLGLRSDKSSLMLTPVLKSKLKIPTQKIFVTFV